MRSQQRERAATEKEAAAARERRRAKRVRVAAFVVLALAAIVPTVIALVALSASTTRAEDVAAALAAPVAQQVLGDARATNLAVARDELDRANARLLARGLPIVPQPAEGASSVVVQIQAARAFVLADQPEDFAQALRDDVAAGRAPAALPSMLTVPIPSAGGDQVVTVLPGTEPAAPRTASPRRSPTDGSSNAGGGNSSTRAPSSGGGGGSAPTGRIPAPTTVPPRGLLPDLPLVPRLPLLGG